MLVPVILELPYQKALHESARHALDSRPRGVLSGTRLPADVQIDRGFSALAISSERGLHPLDALRRGGDLRFAVRGNIDVGRIDDVPHKIDDAGVLADPIVDAYVG